MKKEVIRVKSLDELPEAARRILAFTEEEGVVAIHGGMGAGKTTLVRAICDALGVADAVNSPTFAIVNEYVTRKSKKVYHFDFYRIDKPEEAFDFGYEEYLYGSDLCLIEWPEKVAGLLPGGITHIDIAVDGGGARMVTLSRE